MSSHILSGYYELSIDQMNNYYKDLSDSDVKKVFPPLNSIGWLMGHSAVYNYEIANKIKEIEIPEEADKYRNGQPHSTPDLDNIVNLWEDSVSVVKGSLKLLTDEDLSSKITWIKDGEEINLGTDISRMTFHYWNHLGEIASVRQLLGKDPGNPGYGSWTWRY
ncbi:MAG: hypothetical protein CL762_04220 [Chloroflexi bacterium]|nr:hypothetical protein [Chloroflexota bacterium]